MLKKMLMSIMVFLSILTLSSAAWSSVAGTLWYIQGTMRVTLGIEGYGSETEVADFEDVFAFNADGTFEMIDMGGTWVQKGRNFIVSLTPSDVEEFFQVMLETEGIDVDVTVTKCSFKGKENSSGNGISGKLTMIAELFIPAYDIEGKISVSASFKGTPLTSDTGKLSSLMQDASYAQAKTLVELIGEEILKTMDVR